MNPRLTGERGVRYCYYRCGTRIKLNAYSCRACDRKHRGDRTVRVVLKKMATRKENLGL